MIKPNFTKIPTYFHRYVQRVKEEDLISSLTDQEKSFSLIIQNIPEDKWDFKYENNKWTIKELILHCIDTERIFAYRALSIARKETADMQSFDENSYAFYSKANNRSTKSLKEEFSLIRKSTTILFQGFDQEQLNSEGKVSKQSIYVGGIGFIIVGHLMHHEQILLEKYLK